MKNKTIELTLTEGMVTMPVDALVSNLTYEEIGVIATFKAAFENALHDNDKELSASFDKKLSDLTLARVLKSLKERNIFEIVTEGQTVTLRFDIEKAK